MPTYSKAPIEIHELAQELLEEFRDSHDRSYGDILDSNLRIDFMLAFSDKDEKSGAALNDAITHQGVRALGLCSIINLKDRSAGLGDVRILLDGDEWDKMQPVEQRSLVDHELHHILIAKTDGAFRRDDLNRPKVKMRKHDIQVGMFSVIAARHGSQGIERRDFRKLVDTFGQYLMPEIYGNPGGETIAAAARNLRDVLKPGDTLTMSTNGREPVIIKG